MTSSGPERIYHLEGGLEGISALTEHIASFLCQKGWGEAQIYRVILVLDELLTNTVSYGYPRASHACPMEICVEMSMTPEGLHLVLKDNGIPFNPLNKPAPSLQASVEDRPIGGLGIHLMRSFMDHISYERQGNTNILTLKSAYQGEA